MSGSRIMGGDLEQYFDEWVTYHMAQPSDEWVAYHGNPEQFLVSGSRFKGQMILN